MDIPEGWSIAEDFSEKKYVKTVTDPETGRERKVRYGAKGYTIAPGTSKGTVTVPVLRARGKTTGTTATAKTRTLLSV